MTALLTIADAAKHLGLKPQGVKRLIDAGQLETRVAPGYTRPRVTLTSIERWLAPRSDMPDYEPDDGLTTMERRQKDIRELAAARRAAQP